MSHGTTPLGGLGATDAFQFVAFLIGGGSSTRSREATRLTLPASHQNGNPRRT